MARKATGWTCRRVSCKFKNPPRTRKCQQCGKPKPVKKLGHRQVLKDLTYADFVEINGGDHCGICGKLRSETRRNFDRDHDHITGKPRGLLCHRENRALPYWMTSKWLRDAADYLDRAADRKI